MMVRYTLGMSSDDCGGRSEYAVRTSALRVLCVVGVILIFATHCVRRSTSFRTYATCWAHPRPSRRSASRSTTCWASSNRSTWRYSTAMHACFESMATWPHMCRERERERASRVLVRQTLTLIFRSWPPQEQKKIKRREMAERMEQILRKKDSAKNKEAKRRRYAASAFSLSLSLFPSCS
jgi:hypothetical protein